MAMLAALICVSLAAQAPLAVMVVRPPVGTPDEEHRLATAIGDLVPGLHVQMLPGVANASGADRGLSFAEAFDIVRGDQVALQTVNDRECRNTTMTGCGADLPLRARRVLDGFDEQARQTLAQLAQVLRRAADAGGATTLVYVSTGLPFRVEPRREFEVVRQAARESHIRLILVDAQSEGRGRAGLERLSQVTQAERFGVSSDDRSRLHALLAAPATASGESRTAPSARSARAPRTTPSLAVLEVATQHAVKFAAQGASLLADEHTVQEVKVRPSASSLSPGSNAGILNEKRVLESEVALVHIGSNDLWLLARDIVRVNGKAVPDADRIRLPSMHPASTPEALRQFAQVAEQGARFNIGGIERNVNTPTLALWLLTPAIRPRLDFIADGTARVDGHVCDLLTFRERRAPYLFVVDGVPAPVSGRLWVDRGRGAVLRTELSLPDEAIDFTPSRATVRVTFTHDPTLSVWVPRSMSERYDSQSSRQFVVATSTYTNVRMFSVSARIIK